MIRRRRPGLGYAAAALLALASFGTGCTTPAPKGVLAVERVQDGGVRLLLAGCPGYVARDFSVFADTEDDASSDWSVHNGGQTGAVDGVQLFQPPPQGWTSTGGNLTALQKGVPYVATVNGTVGDRGLRGRVPFTSDDLSGLKNGEVLTWNGGNRNTTSNRDDFLQADPTRCKP